jgi:hypothetical protein
VFLLIYYSSGSLMPFLISDLDSPRAY